jgi:transcription antitermination factor NusA-like protein
MKAPVCGICLKSGILCRSCEEKVRNGDVSETEVKIAGALLKLSERRKALRDIEMVRAAESPEAVVIVCGKGDAAKIIGASGQTVRGLEKEMGKRVMIAEEADDMSGFVQNLISPLKLVSINTLYRDGRELLKMVTKGKGKRISSRDFSAIIKAIYGREAEIAGE